MSKTPFKKKLLTRFLNDQQHEYLIQKQDIENAVFEQAQSAKQTKHLSTNIQTHQHGSTVDTKGKASHIKHFNYTDQQRQKLIKQYTKQQREDPTVSSLKIVQRITQDSKPLSPSTETLIAPSANLYPALQANHTDTQLLNPFAPSALSRTLQNLAIPGFFLPNSLSRNKIALKKRNYHSRKNHRLLSEKNHPQFNKNFATTSQNLSTQTTARHPTFLLS